MERLFTIGVYGFDVDNFFGTLQHAGIDLVLDIRRRRGIRGPLYPFANAVRLQHELAERGIAYRHILALAPDPSTRALQNQADTASRLPKRQRQALAPAYVTAYTQRSLDPFDWDALATELEAFQRPTLLCVERTPEACHRHLVAPRLASAARVPMTDLVP